MWGHRLFQPSSNLPGGDRCLFRSLEIPTREGLPAVITAGVEPAFLRVEADVEEARTVPAVGTLHPGWVRVGPLWVLILGEEALGRVDGPSRPEKGELVAIAGEARPHPIPVAVGVMLVDAGFLMGEVHLALL